MTFTITSTSPDVTRLRYRWLGTNPVSVDGSTATLDLEPPTDGRLILMVQSVNSFGQPSQDTYFMLFVRPAPGPVGSWEFNDGSGTTAADGPGLTHPLALTGPTFEAFGRLDGGLALDGVDDYASASESVVDTTQSFSISVWARPMNPSKLGVIAAANGADTTAAGLGYDPSSRRWVFARTAADVANPTLYKASSKEPPVNGAWSHLLATYYASTGALKLYVNGRLQQETSAPIASAWKATGPLTVGRGFLAGAAGGYFSGSLDHLQIWQRVLLPEEVLELQAPRSSQGPVVTGDAAHWPLDTAVRGQDGIWRSADTIRGADFTVAGFQGSDQSAAFVADADRGKVLELSGARRESVGLGRPVVDGSASFSVAVMVKIADPTKPGVIVRQGSSTKDTWRLAYEPDGATAKFTFARANADTSTETVATSPIYDGDSLDSWHLLVGTYRVDPRDPSNDSIELTMDLRSRDGSSARFAAPTRDGAVVVGRPGPIGTPFIGRLDDIRIYTGDLSPIKACQDYPGLEACGS